MGKRIKEVHKESQVAHLWAQSWQPDAQQHARNARSTFYFHGDTIYSYGDHFPIARHVVNAKGKRAILYTTRDYSPTTAGHKATVRGAIWRYTEAGRECDCPAFNVIPELCLTHEENFESYPARMNTALEHMYTARGKAGEYAREYERLHNEANEYRKFFGVQVPPLKIGKKLREALDEAHAKTNKAGIAQEQARATRDAKRAMKEAEYKALWLQGAGYGGRFSGPVVLRFAPNNNAIIQTSLGAEIPADEGKRLYEFVQVVKARGEDWNRNGERQRVGAFEVATITKTGDITAVCHYIENAAIEDFARRAGWKN